MQIAETCYCQTFKTCCCEHAKNTAAAQITYMKSPRSRYMHVELGRRMLYVANGFSYSIVNYNSHLHFNNF